MALETDFVVIGSGVAGLRKTAADDHEVGLKSHGETVSELQAIGR